MKRFFLFLAFPLIAFGCSPEPSCSVNDATYATANYSGTNSIVLTEISNSYYNNVNNWIEIKNISGGAITLSNYTLIAMGMNPSSGSGTSSPVSFPLPNITVAAGSYAVLYTQGGTDYAGLTGTNVAVIATSSGYMPWWGQSGYLEIQNSGNTTEDFVRFGGSGSYGPNNGGWQGNAPCLNAGATAYGKSIARTLDLGDTNKGNDWKFQTFATPGGQNDTQGCTADADHDGIPDCSEVSGSTFAGMNLFAMGVRTSQEDILVEVDWMDASVATTPNDPGILPDATAMQNVVDAFAAKGINLIIDAGARYNNLGGGNVVTYSSSVTIGKVTGYANLYSLKAQNMDIARKQIFHYALFGSSQLSNGAGGSSGLAEVNGNDLLITMGEWGLTAGNTLTNFQASTFMHELGHNLGLLHGGSESTNYKPNYISIMNYMYQLNGLPASGTTDSNLIYKYEANLAGMGGSCTTAANAWSKSPDTLNFILDYSDGSGGNLNESNLDESAGLKRTNYANVDFNCNGSTANAGISYNINFDSNSGQAHSDYNDWNNLDLFFGRNHAGQSFSSTGELILTDPIGDDHQELIYEDDLFSKISL